MCEKSSRLLLTLSLLLTALAFVPVLQAAPPPEAVVASERGFAELENEKPEEAEASYARVIELMPKDPLGHANLAISLLRQQRFDEALTAIDRALELTPDRPDLLAIRGEVRQWSGDHEGSLVDLDAAALGAPDDLEIQYAAYQAATTLVDADDNPLAVRTLGRLAELRPENLVVILQRLQGAIASGDRPVATAALIRVEELLWQAPDLARRALGLVKEALRSDDLGDARVPAVRLENVLKVQPMFRESLRELKTGIQGIPVQTFLGEPPAADFGPPRAIRFAAETMDAVATLDVASGDFDGDSRPDLVRLRADGAVEVLLAATLFKPTALPPAGGQDGQNGKPQGMERLLVIDLNNDHQLDVLAYGATSSTIWVGGETGLERAQVDLGLGDIGALELAAVDFDIEGDLDLAGVGGSAGSANLWRNSLIGPLEKVSSGALPPLPSTAAQAVTASDLDRDGDLDILVGHGRGLMWLDNLRQGRFVDRSAAAGLEPRSAVRSVVAADLNADGLPEAVAAGDGLSILKNVDGRFEPWDLGGLTDTLQLDRVIALDADNDGRRDLAAVGADGLLVLSHQGGGTWRSLAIDGLDPEKTSTFGAVTAADLDQDGDLDLVAGGPSGLVRFKNQGGSEASWLTLRLTGLDKGSSKNNTFGVGSTIEVKVGGAYQFYEAAGDAIHIGLGEHKKADVVRVVWTNGVPQNRIDLEGNQRLVEEQLLKGSCPFVYVWDGEGFAFGTDLLWGAPIGLPAAPGVWVSSDPTEIVRLDGLVLDGSRYKLRITEELWEAAFFDRLRLWVVDHPNEVEVASALRIVPGRPSPEKVLGSRSVQPVAAAWDGRGRDATDDVARRDDVYADGYTPSPYQGVAAEPWTFTIDLGDAPAAPVRLLLDGWIFPSDASLNLAVAQRDDLPYLPPRLEVEVDGEWQLLMDDVGFPAGKTKTTVVDTPALPAGASTLRLVTSLWLHWDRIAWTTDVDDAAPQVVARLEADVAQLRYRGFSALVRRAPNAPHTFDYQKTRLDTPWSPFPGHYTRFGDVRELLAETDDFAAILGPGDEIAVEFDAGELEPVAPGFTRTLFLESHGWDKDADRNTYEGQRLEPLPFHAMESYGDAFPETPDHRRYVEEWLTRRVDG
ncbi:MAG: FG-GAP-like repeat-containing protein [Acidobacteriota bacterium]